MAERGRSEAGVSAPKLSGVVVHWRNPEQLRRLVESWPRDPRFELMVVDNGGAGEAALEELAEGRRLCRLEPGLNLGFGGGANLGVKQASGELVLILNPDVVLTEGALGSLLEGFRRHPEAGGLIPRLRGPGGEPQHRWQLRRLPSPGTLVAQALGLPAGGGAAGEPASGSPVEQPAAAALALRRDVFEAMGGFDEDFYPAWFEDVDLARRLADRGQRLVYWPEAQASHELGASVPALGYGRFLWAYHRNLLRYLGKHHGGAWGALARMSLLAGLILRLGLLPLRRPRRARSRGEAARGLVANLAGLLSGWRRPGAWSRELSPGAEA